MAKVTLSPPWVIFYKEVEAFFKYDSDVKVIYDEDKVDLKLYVDGSNKANALTQLLPTEKTFGNIILKITVIPSNKLKNSKASKSSLYEDALTGNGALSYIRTATGIFTNPITYVVFKNKVVQYWTDDLGDINGLRSTLYQEIAKEIFVDTDGIYFCTDEEEPVNVVDNGEVLFDTSFGSPLGEWP